MPARVFALVLAFILESPLAQASEKLSIGADHGTIDFAIGNSKIFRTTGSFKNWQGAVNVDDAEAPKSTVEVVVNTDSIQMLDTQQTAMLKDSDFFDVEKFPKMTFESIIHFRRQLKVHVDIAWRSARCFFPPGADKNSRFSLRPLGIIMALER